MQKKPKLWKATLYVSKCYILTFQCNFQQCKYLNNTLILIFEELAQKQINQFLIKWHHLWNVKILNFLDWNGCSIKGNQINKEIKKFFDTRRLTLNIYAVNGINKSNLKIRRREKNIIFSRFLFCSKKKKQFIHWQQNGNENFPVLMWELLFSLFVTKTHEWKMLRIILFCCFVYIFIALSHCFHLMWTVDFSII